ncbi:hypothetical protein D3C75_969260 [compost metagenome]
MRKTPAVDGLHRDTNFTRFFSPANGITAAQFFASKASFQGQMLAGFEGVMDLQICGHFKSDGNRFRSFLLNARHL